MKRIVRSAAMLGMVTLASVATVHAQGAGRASFHVAGGITLPMGDFGDVAKTGWQALGGVSFGLGGLPFAVRVDGIFGQNSIDVSDVDAKVQMFGGFAGAQFNLGGAAATSIKPYILAQIGMVNSKCSGDDCLSDESNSDFAFAGGGGIGFGLGSMSAFVEGTFTSVMSDPNSSNFVTARLASVSAAGCNFARTNKKGRHRFDAGLFYCGLGCCPPRGNGSGGGDIRTGVGIYPGRVDLPGLQGFPACSM